MDCIYCVYCVLQRFGLALISLTVVNCVDTEFSPQHINFLGPEGYIGGNMEPVFTL